MKKMLFLTICIFISAVLFAQQDSLVIESDGTISVQMDGEAVPLVEFLNPVGTIQAYGGTDDPNGWLICDGREVSKATYNRLYAAIGDFFGTPIDPVNNFVIPDLRGQFLRGLDNPGTEEGAAGVDPESVTRSIGTAQNDAFQGHHHRFHFYDSRKMTASDPYSAIRVATPTQVFSDAFVKTPISDGTNGSPRTAPETRPVNVAVNFIIKY